ncbi:hypothetical protein FACS1894199_03550 [Bacteroidia bacterium]|nr:hypothetical protein FACS1894199_03550 [Bacteroidia bacterium]
MPLFENSEEFISPKQEKKESDSKLSLKGVIDGRWAQKAMRNNLPLILFWTLLAVFYISNGYSTENLHKQRLAMEKEVQELRFESVTTASQLMFICKQSEVKKRMQEVGLDLKENQEPPVRIYKKK